MSNATTKARSLFAQLHGLTGLTSVARAKAEPALWLERLATKAAIDQGPG